MTNNHPIRVERNYTKSNNALYEDGHMAAMGASAWAVFGAICCNFKDKDAAKVTITFDDIKRLTGFSKDTIQKAVNRLREMKYILVEEVKATQGFKTIFSYILPNLPEVANVKATQNKGGDISKAVEGKKAAATKKQQLVLSQPLPQSGSRLYKAHVRLAQLSGKDAYAEAQFYRVDHIKKVIEKYGEELLEKCYLWILRLVKKGFITNTADYFFKPEKAIADYREALREQQAREANAKRLDQKDEEMRARLEKVRADAEIPQEERQHSVIENKAVDNNKIVETQKADLSPFYRPAAQKLLEDGVFTEDIFQLVLTPAKEVHKLYRDRFLEWNGNKKKLEEVAIKLYEESPSYPEAAD